jgi:allophanate hydrolase
MRLYGLPFAVKDNIDVAGLTTTAGCPAFAYAARRSAAVVERLIAEGAILIGKTNLDQFATGLSGARSPYGIPENPFDPRYITGGSSSGSAVCVARGFCAFALGTDTAGSGRVPAAFNGVVGIKPSFGMLSARGVVPACRSLDCVSVFALTVDDACEVAHALAGFDPGDPFARPEAGAWDPHPGQLPPRLRVALPSAPQRPLDAASQPAFELALEAVARLGGAVEEIDFAPFAEAGALLYEGPWVAERLEATGELLGRDPGALHPAVREILASALRYRALDAFRALHALQTLRGKVDALFDRSDVLLVPSAPTIFRIDEMLADPIRLNAQLGTYANFVNLLDLCALAVPAGRRADGLPFGITLIARRGRDALLATAGRALQAELGRTLGATEHPLPPLPARPVAASADRVALAVVGAHLSGEPLNAELTDLGARLLSSTQTAARYRLFALSTTPPKPGLVRAPDGEPGHAIELEVWELQSEALGRFMRRVAAPLCIGMVELADGARVHGFLCEHAATEGRRDISSFGGWRAYRRSMN